VIGTAPDLHWLPARALAGLIARRELSAVEAVRAQLARIEMRNPGLTAVVSLDADGALAAAAAADAALASGAPAGPLHGVPMTLKDGHDVAGLRTTVGTAALDRTPEHDGTVAARLRAAGAIIVGHTNVPPWLADYQSANPLFGATVNPWDPARTAGGSSGGAAAALAAGLTPLEVGSDLAGSLRLPAHFCGVYGLKTTEHRVALTGFMRGPGGGPRSVRIAGVLGPMARDLDDLELGLSVIAGPDGRDGDVPPVRLDRAPEPGLAGLRVAVAPVVPEAAVARAVAREVERVAAALCDAGAAVEARLPDVDWARQLELFGDLLGAITGIFDPAARLREEQRSLAWYLAALDERDRFAAAWDRFFADVDVLVLPAGMTVAFAHSDPGAPVDVDGRTVPYGDHGRPYAALNLVGLPALAAPSGHTEDGMPVGVQLVGPRWSEPALLALARRLEATGILPGFRPPPGA
jgi:amidase